jgi:capsular polysaccharide biosynthesis protein
MNQNTTDTECCRAEAKKSDENREKQRQKSGMKHVPQSINLVELFYYLLSKLHFIVIGIVLGAVLLGMYATYMVTPIYSATSKLRIMGTTGTNIIADLQIGTSLTMDYQEVFKTWEVNEMVNEELGANYSYGTLQSILTVTNPEDTHILYITVDYPDPQTAADIANAFASAAKRFIVQNMNTDEPSIFSTAQVPTSPSSGSVNSYVVRGVLLGTVMSVGILVLVFLLDNRPKSPEDIMRYAGIPTLAVIPENKELSGLKHKRKAGRL